MCVVFLSDVFFFPQERGAEYIRRFYLLPQLCADDVIHHCKDPYMSHSSYLEYDTGFER